MMQKKKKLDKNFLFEYEIQNIVNIDLNLEYIIVFDKFRLYGVKFIL